MSNSLFTMLCTFCATLDFDAACSKRGAAHHETWSDLCASARAGCELCMRILGSGHDTLDRPAAEFLPNTHQKIRCFYDNDNSWLFWAGHPYKAANRIRSIHVCTAYHDPMSTLLWSRQPFSDPRSDSFFSQMQTWVDTCLIKHDLCRSDGGKFWETLTGSYEKRSHLPAAMPTRVIDVGDDEKSPSLFISQGRFGRWAALSHCWGKDQPLKLESKSISAFTDGISLDSMPPLFQDAVFITRRLGFRYLWIDCLCIVQDSKEDWLTESLKMGDTYKNAIVTFSAEAAEDSSIGILSSTARGRMRESDKNPKDIIQLSSRSAAHSVEGNLIVPSKSAISTAIDAQGPLSARKWVLQEETLSTRLIRFAEGQVWWQCRVLQCNERFPSGYVPSNRSWDKEKGQIRDRVEWNVVRSFLLTSRRAKAQSKYNAVRLISSHQIKVYWYNTVNAYCCRHMTRDTDSLPAISGIAKEYQRQLLYNHKSYKAGIWLNDLPQGLLWYTPRPGARTASSYVAPSWSWVSVASGAYYDLQLLEDLIPDESLLRVFGPRGKPRGIASVLAINLVMCQDDSFGQVQSGFMRLKGPCHELCRCSIPASFLDYFIEDGEVILKYSNVQQIFKATEGKSIWSNVCTVSDFAGRACKQGADIQHKRCLVVHIISSKRLAQAQKIAFALILEHAEDDVEQYRRIGLAMLLENTKSSRIWPTREITVI